jgi:hypothetical protein
MLTAAVAAAAAAAAAAAYLNISLPQYTVNVAQRNM